jgi:RNA polymerase-binding transcription factor DksA
MSGYIGNPDAEAEHALILSENGVAAARQQMAGRVLTHCLECHDEIPEARRQAAIRGEFKCWYCISCQEIADKNKPRIKMLDRIL